MRNLNQFIITLMLCASANSYAWNVSIDPLYWQVDEPIDWASVSNRNPTNNQVSYKTVTFPYRPGLRVGIGYEANWFTNLYYTGYQTKSTGSTTGNIESGFLGARIALLLNGGGSYTAGQYNFKIQYHTLDWNIGKTFAINSALSLSPFTGLRAAMIDQEIITTLQGSISIAEHTKNDFKGIGPKAGVETRLAVYKTNDYRLNLVADFVTAYLWGNWSISDVLNHVPPSVGNNIDIGLGNRSYGSLAFQALLGLNLSGKHFSATLGYELNDWFDQYQVFDNGTGGHDNDLVLQGLTLNLAYNFD